ncbi:MAG: ATP phosphoribosyltransferase regulatory subunit [Ruminococcus sp.]|jgi:ATP phosphoribosyltransferase regulatory subunit|nr:ATP phosphoribosyltransferase regulatory subunit [Ruminococcus sp.]
MEKYTVKTPEGTCDILGNLLKKRREIEEKCYNFFSRAGYIPINTPSLEYFNTINLHSQHFNEEDLYKLTDTTGRLLILRPDHTLPIARAFASRHSEIPLPARFYYSGDVYRVNTVDSGKNNQIYQVGVEIIGNSGNASDLEILSGAVECLEKCDTADYILEIGNVGFFNEIMKSLNAPDDIKEKIRFLIEIKNKPELNKLLDTIVGNNDEVRILRELPNLFGGVEVVEKAESLYPAWQTEDVLKDVRLLYNCIVTLPKKGRIQLDLGLVHRLDYYTGIVIKGYIAGSEIISGGRYDNLMQEFGINMPAIGFAIDLDEIVRKF